MRTRCGGPMATTVHTSEPGAAGESLPLSGITVISCEQAVAAPFASRRLADLGARGGKAERPGDGAVARGCDTTVNGLASHVVCINRSEESRALALKHPEGIRILRELSGSADVFIQSCAPGAADRLGLGAEELR